MQAFWFVFTSDIGSKHCVARRSSHKNRLAARLWTSLDTDKTWKQIYECESNMSLKSSISSRMKPDKIHYIIYNHHEKCLTISGRWDILFFPVGPQSLQLYPFHAYMCVHVSVYVHARPCMCDCVCVCVCIQSTCPASDWEDSIFNFRCELSWKKILQFCITLLGNRWLGQVDLSVTNQTTTHNLANPRGTT